MPFKFSSTTIFKRQLFSPTSNSFKSFFPSSFPPSKQARKKAPFFPAALAFSLSGYYYTLISSAHKLNSAMYKERGKTINMKQLPCMFVYTRSKQRGGFFSLSLAYLFRSLQAAWLHFSNSCFLYNVVASIGVSAQHHLWREKNCVKSFPIGVCRLQLIL